MATITESNHLRNLLQTQAGSVDAQVVFLDIVSYSKRKSSTQRKIVEELQRDVDATLDKISAKHIKFVQENNLNFSTDVIKIPTGDGAALAFSFGGLQEVAIDFAESFLNRIFSKSKDDPCAKFDDVGWCNCHSHYSVRIGVNEGKSIFFEDMNKQVNVAGTCINDTARIMNAADGYQILVSEASYSNLVDMSSRPNLEDQFRDIGTIEVKHGKKIAVYQYVGKGEPFINAGKPVKIALKGEMDRQMSILGLSKANMARDPAESLEIAQALGSLMEKMFPAGVVIENVKSNE